MLHNEPLSEFFVGAVAELRAAFAGSKKMSNSTKGTAREDAVRGVLGPILPSMLRIVSGDMIDSYGNRSGQLDAVAIEHRSPVLQTSKGRASLILVEGAVAVFEVKSSLNKQWNEVIRTYRKVATLRPRTRKVHRVVAPLVHSTVPFIVIGGRGWQNASTLLANTRRLWECVPEPRPDILTWSIDPCRVAVVRGIEDAQAYDVDPDSESNVLASIWRSVSRRGREKSFRVIPWASYFQGAPRAL